MKRTLLCWLSVLGVTTLLAAPALGDDPAGPGKSPVGPMKARAKEKREDLKEKREDLKEKLKDKRDELKEKRDELRDAARDNATELRERWQKLRETRKERRQERRAEIKKKWGAIEKKPAVRSELKIHAWRMARLKRLRAIAEADGKKDTVARIDKLTQKENERHDKHMQKLNEKGGEE